MIEQKAEKKQAITQLFNPEDTVSMEISYDCTYELYSESFVWKAHWLLFIILILKLMGKPLKWLSVHAWFTRARGQKVSLTLNEQPSGENEYI
jgi:hypothetical protein